MEAITDFFSNSHMWIFFALSVGYYGRPSIWSTIVQIALIILFVIKFGWIFAICTAVFSITAGYAALKLLNLIMVGVTMIPKVGIYTAIVVSFVMTYGLLALASCDFILLLKL